VIDVSLELDILMLQKAQVSSRITELDTQNRQYTTLTTYLKRELENLEAEFETAKK